MAILNMQSIISKVRAYSKSDAGKERIGEYLDDCVKSGKEETEAGSTVITIDSMNLAAEAMISTLQNIASARKLPESVLAHFQSLAHSAPELVDGESRQYNVDIYFTDDLSRLSLLIVGGEKAGKRTGEGIENIVSLFDTGYGAESVVRGIWDGHEEAGVIFSREDREEMRFMQDAVDEFNRDYGDMYGVSASITADSKFYAR